MMGHLKGISQRDSHPWVWMTSGRGVPAKFDRIIWCSGWTPRLEKFSEKSWWAFSSRNWTWKGGTGRLEVEEDLEQKGFRVELDLRLGAMRSLWEREREREREKYNTVTKEYKETKERVCMNMWRAKNNCIMGWSPIQTYQHTIFNNQAHI